MQCEKCSIVCLPVIWPRNWWLTFRMFELNQNTNFRNSSIASSIPTFPKNPQPSTWKELLWRIRGLSNEPFKTFPFASASVQRPKFIRRYPRKQSLRGEKLIRGVDVILSYLLLLLLSVNGNHCSPVTIRPSSFNGNNLRRRCFSRSLMR